MYATLSLKRLIQVLSWPLGIILLLYVVIRGVPTDPWAGVRMIGTVITIWGLVLIVFGGFSGKWAVWRLLWQIVPVLNKKAFPDLNGVWEGATESNWPSISAMLAAAEGNGGLVRQGLATIPLKSDAMTLTIKASLFSFRVSAQLHSTGSKSHSLTERVSEDKRRDKFELYYVYRQETPQPELTDEDSHLGAATLEIDLENWCLEGAYWTKRSWRSGLNTAGLIKVKRISR